MKRCLLLFISVSLMLFLMESTRASTFGSVPYAFFKAASSAVLSFTSVGAKTQASGGYVTNQESFVYGTGNTSDGYFNRPEGVAVDATNGYIYVMDTGNSRIVKMVLSTGVFVGAVGKILTTSSGTCPNSGVATTWCTGGYFAGSSVDGGFSGAKTLAVDPAGTYLYVADNGNNRIVKINASTGAFVGAIGKTTASSGTCPVGVVTGWCTGGTFASGAGDGMFNGPWGITTDGTYLYIVDYWNSRIVKVNASTGAFVGAIGKTTASSGTCPVGVATGWCTGGTFTNGGGDGVFSNPVNIAIDTVNGYIFEIGNEYKISKFDAVTGAFIGAIGKVASSTGTCTVGVTTGWCTGGNFTLSTSDGAFYGPYAIGIDSTNGFLYAADSPFGYSRVMKFNLTAGTFVGAVGGTSASTGTCPSTGAATGFCTGGTFKNGAADGWFDQAEVIAADGSGNIYIADTLNSRIAKVNGSTGAWVGATGGIYSFASTWSTGLGTGSAADWDGTYNTPAAIAVDGRNGYLYVGENVSSGRVIKLNLITGTFVGAIGQTTASYGTCPYSGTTSSWCTGGDFQSGSGDGQYSYTRGIAIDSTGTYLYYADWFSNRIDKINAVTGAFVGSIGKTSASTGSCPASGAAPGWCIGGTFASGAGDGMFNAPRGLAIDNANGYLYVVDYGNYRIVKINLVTGAFVGAIGNTSATSGTCPATGATSGWCTGGTFATGTADGMFSGPSSATVDATGTNLYVVDESSSRVIKINATTGAFVGAIGKTTASSGTCPVGTPSGWCTGGTFSSGSSDGQFWAAKSIATDGSYIYVSDASTYRISKFNAGSGKFIGAIGKLSSSTGTCPASGATTKWCTKGTFTNGNGDGMFAGVWAITADTVNGGLYATDTNNHRIVRIK